LDGVLCAQNAAEMIDALERAIADDSPERRRQRSEAARENSWERRILELSAAIADLERKTAALA